MAFKGRGVNGRLCGAERKDETERGETNRRQQRGEEKRERRREKVKLEWGRHG